MRRATVHSHVKIAIKLEQPKLLAVWRHSLLTTHGIPMQSAWQANSSGSAPLIDLYASACGLPLQQHARALHVCKDANALGILVRYGGAVACRWICAWKNPINYIVCTHYTLLSVGRSVCLANACSVDRTQQRNQTPNAHTHTPNESHICVRAQPTHKVQVGFNPPSRESATKSRCKNRVGCVVFAPRRPSNVAEC